MTGSGGDPDFLETERERIDAALAEVSRAGVAGLNERLREPVEYALSTTGKRLRPILCIFAYSAASGRADPPPAAYRLGCALEIVHTYSLVHDDLPCMDDDDLRRGRPTVHRLYGVALATLAGAALLPIAIDIVSREAKSLGLESGEQGRLVRELTRAAGAGGMVGGQLLDLEAERRPVTAADLEEIHSKKTAALLTASLRLGAIAGVARDDLLDSLTRYGAALGLAFQITDDLLDVEGSSEYLGKTAGRDLELLKASYPAVHGVAATRELARAKVDEAKAAISGLGLTRLEQLADYVIERRK